MSYNVENYGVWGNTLRISSHGSGCETTEWQLRRDTAQYAGSMCHASVQCLRPGHCFGQRMPHNSTDHAGSDDSYWRHRTGLVFALKVRGSAGDPEGIRGDPWPEQGIRPF